MSQAIEEWTQTEVNDILGSVVVRCRIHWLAGTILQGEWRHRCWGYRVRLERVRGIGRHCKRKRRFVCDRGEYEFEDNDGEVER